MNIPSMWRRACMRHLLCMRTPVRFGVADGAIDVTSAAVGKVSDKRVALSLSMSALGQKRTFAVQYVMSALHPKGTFAVQPGMSAKCR